MNTVFFLGANAPEGFASYYGEWLDYSKLKRLYIIKGTPGNGKSGFMRRIAKRLGEKGCGCEFIICSSDPSSLDGVYFPDLETAFVDGSAPHIIEPRYPLAVDHYLPLTQFVNDQALERERGSIVELRDGLALGYSRLSRITTAKKAIKDEQHLLVMDETAAGSIRRRAQGFIKREMKKGTNGKVRRRFLSALTPQGEEIQWSTVDALAGRVIELRDPYHMADYFLQPVLKAALEAKQEVYACYDPLAPFSRLSHLILPGLSLALTSAPYPGNVYRRMRLDAAVPAEIQKKHRLRLRFLRKTEAALRQDACGVLAQTRELHCMLEDIYNPHVDFLGVRALADAYADRILP
jgi:hypothetical protein